MLLLVGEFNGGADPAVQLGCGCVFHGGLV